LSFILKKMTENVFLIKPEWADKDFIIEGNWFIYENSPVKIIAPASASEELSLNKNKEKDILSQNHSQTKGG
jgi:hypothetical protein